jgi:hypothetical protein
VLLALKHLAQKLSRSAGSKKKSQLLNLIGNGKDPELMRDELELEVMRDRKYPIAQEHPQINERSETETRSPMPLSLENLLMSDGNQKRAAQCNHWRISFFGFFVEVNVLLIVGESLFLDFSSK